MDGDQFLSFDHWPNVFRRPYTIAVDWYAYLEAHFNGERANRDWLRSQSTGSRRNRPPTWMGQLVRCPHRRPGPRRAGEVPIAALLPVAFVMLLRRSSLLGPSYRLARRIRGSAGGSRSSGLSLTDICSPSANAPHANLTPVL